MNTRRYVAAAMVMLALTLGTGCSQGSESAAEPVSGQGGSPDVGAPPEMGEGGKAGAPGEVLRNVGSAKAVERTGSLTLEVAQPADAAARLRSIASAMGGTVASENIAVSADGEMWSAASSLVVLSVPTDKLSAAMDEVSKQGTVRNRATTEQDLTLVVTDVESRITTLRASVARVRALLADAKSLTDVTAIESELTRREADLESMLAQQAILEERTTMAQLTVSLLTPAQVVHEDRNPFMRGLTDGWHAFGEAVAGLLVAVGAVLPFLAVLALVVVPVALWWRRRGWAGRSHPGPRHPEAPDAAV